MFNNNLFYQKRLGYTPKVCMLKPDAVPTLHLPPDHSQSLNSTHRSINQN